MTNAVMTSDKLVPGLTLENDPYCAGYVFPKITLPGITSAQLAEYSLEKNGIALIAGNVFGRDGDGHLRLSYSCSYENCEKRAWNDCAKL